MVCLLLCLHHKAPSLDTRFSAYTVPSWKKTPSYSLSLLTRCCRTPQNLLTLASQPLLGALPIEDMCRLCVKFYGENDGVLQKDGTGDPRAK